MSYTIVLKALLEKEDADLSMLDDAGKENFEKAAEELFQREYYLEAVKAFTLLKNRERLSVLGKACLEKKNFAVAFFAFKAADDVQGLNKTGEEYLKLQDISTALGCFEAAKNYEMATFIRQNF